MLCDLDEVWYVYFDSEVYVLFLVEWLCIFVMYMWFEFFLGVLCWFDIGLVMIVVFGFVNCGGMLDVLGLLFVNCSIWVYVVDVVVGVFGQFWGGLLLEVELVVVDGWGDLVMILCFVSGLML